MHTKQHNQPELPIQDRTVIDISQQIADLQSAINKQPLTARVVEADGGAGHKLIYDDEYKNNAAVGAGLTALGLLWRMFEQIPDDPEEPRRIKELSAQYLEAYLELAPLGQRAKKSGIPLGDPMMVAMLTGKAVSYLDFELESHGIIAAPVVKREEVSLADDALPDSGARDEKQLELLKSSSASDPEESSLREVNVPDSLDEDQEQGILLKPFSALLQYFLTDLPASKAHRNRLAMARDIIYSCPDLDTEMSLMLYGLNDGSEFSKLPADKFSSFNLVIPSGTDVILTETAILDNSPNSKVESLALNPRRFFVFKDRLPETCSSHLVLSLGPFAFMEDKYAQQGLSNLLESVHENGFAVVSFMSDANPHKKFLSEMIDWKVKHRSPEEILGLVPEGYEHVDLPLVSDMKNLANRQFALVPVEPDGINYLLIFRK